MLWHVITAYDFLPRDVQPTQPASDLWVCDEYYKFILNVCSSRWAFMEWHINKCTHAMKGAGPAPEPLKHKENHKQGGSLLYLRDPDMLY